MELRERLQSALVNSYRIDQELGRGGMSRVFVAHDPTLGREVVIKVLPPELAASVSVARFKREIKIAAPLQHPNIVPLLAAGEVDNLPYYTMPFVAGESLRERLTRIERLSIVDALAILRDISRALAYAHRQGIVHRDIKPENVLLTDGVAVVTDFGIGKALSDSRIASDGEGLTRTGVSIGTPTYMAPEQAAGDPGTDHRADIYALGVVAYELLSGNPPFHERSPQAQLAAQMNEAPSPLHRSGAQMPPGLAALVMNCLEKAPEARPQSADEVVRQLEATIAAIGATREAGAMRRAVVMYCVAFAAVVIATWTAMYTLGLPDWVLPGAIVVMALGLPVILFTGYIRHAVTHGSVFASRARRHVTWRRTAVGGVLAVGGFVVAVVVYMVLRATGVGPPGTLLAAGTLSAKERLLVTDFNVSGLDSSLGPVIAEATRTALGQSRAISIATPAAVAAGLRRMRRSDNERIDLTLGRELARREGIRGVVHGEVTPLGAGFLATLRLVGTDSGNTLASVRATADAPRDLIGSVDDLARQLRSKIGESLKSIRSDPPLEQVTTSSLEALRSYTEAMRANKAADFTRAVILYREAIAKDSTFAMAWRALGANLNNLNQPAARDSALSTAFRHRDRLTQRESLMLETNYSMRVELDRAKYIRTYERIAERFSEPISSNVAMQWLSRREAPRAESLYRMVTARDSNDANNTENLALAFLSQGKLAEAESLLALAGKRFPRSAWRTRPLVKLVYLNGDLDSYERALDSLRKFDADFKQEAVFRLAALALIRGRIADYYRFNAEARQIQVTRGQVRRVLYDAILDASIDLTLRRDNARAVRRLDAAFDTLSATMSRGDGDLFGVARLYAMAGRPDWARAVFQRISTEVSDPHRRRFLQPTFENVAAYIALSEGRHDEAIASFRNGDLQPDGPIHSCRICLLNELGISFDLANRPDSAIIMFEGYLRSTFQRLFDDRASLWTTAEDNIHLNVDVTALAHVYERLGQLYEQQGNRERSALYYSRFVDLWKGADPELQPRVREARRRLARMQRSIG